MNEAAITRYIANNFAGVDVECPDETSSAPKIAWGDTFFIYDPEQNLEPKQRFPFGTRSRLVSTSHPAHSVTQFPPMRWNEGSLFEDPVFPRRGAYCVWRVVIVCFSDFPVVTNLASTAPRFTTDLCLDVDRRIHPPWCFGVLRQPLVAVDSSDGAGRSSNQAAMAWHKKAYTDWPC